MSVFIATDRKYQLNKESYDFLNQLVDNDISNGKIRSWAKFLITIKLAGIDINDALLDYLISGCSCGEIYNILRGMLNNIDDFDLILKTDTYFLSKIIKNHNSLGFYRLDPNTGSVGDSCRFDSLDVIKDIDDRNPTILIRYFLTTKILDFPERYREIYRICMCEIMKRSILRGKYNPIFLKKHTELKEKFEDERGILSYV